MTYQTEDLEREADALRNQVAYTAETLRDKMSPGQLFDQYVDYLRHSDGSLALHNLKTQARDNPLPLALVGAGLAWFFLGGGPSSNRLRETAGSLSGGDGEGDATRDLAGPAARELDDDWAEDWSDPALGGLDQRLAHDPGDARAMSNDGAMSKLSDKAVAVSDAAGSALSTAGDAVSSARHAVAGAASSMSRSASQQADMARRRAANAADSMRERSQRAGQQMRTTFLDTLEREPLIIGAVGVAVGAAIAAMMPRTRVEDSYVGPYGDRVREEARETVSQGLEQAKDVASEAYQSARSEAGRQRSMPGPVASRMADVAKSAAKGAEQSARTKIEGKSS